MLTLSLILLALSGMFSLYRQFQMLQQNSYFPSRYIKWIKNSFAVQTVICSLMLFACAFLYSRGLYLYLLILCAAALIYRVISALCAAKKSVKPLVFTWRVIRFYTCAFLVCGAFTALALLLRGTAADICAFILLLLCSVTPALCLAARALSAPVDGAFNRYYINDAKKILRSLPDIKVIGITGSYGKTTTKFILTRILSEKYNTVCTPGSFNTTLGVVRTVREKLQPQTQIFVCEMGAKKKGDIKEICDIVKPQYGIITSVGEQHLETFKTVDNVFDTKFELCDSVEAQNGICLANTDSRFLKERIAKKPYCTAIGEGTDYYADGFEISPAGSSFTLHIKDRALKLHTKLLGRHSIADITAAAVTASLLGINDTDIKAAIAALKPAEHRLEMKPYANGSVLIDDAYNSNPEGCLEALNVLGGFENMRKTVITPGLIELGDKEYEANYNLGLACAKHADDIILVGARYTKPIIEAIEKSGFDKSRVSLVSSFTEGLKKYLEYANCDSVLLIENDLPDNYLK